MAKDGDRSNALIAVYDAACNELIEAYEKGDHPGMARAKDKADAALANLISFNSRHGDT